MGGEEGIRALPLGLLGEPTPLGLLGEPTPLDLLCFLKGIPTYSEWLALFDI